MKAFLSNPVLRSIYLAQLISVAGDRMFAIALAWWVISRDDLPDRQLMLGILLAITTLPIVFSGPLLGIIIDKVNKRTCMLIADVARLALMGALALTIHYDFLTIPILFLFCIPLFALEPLFDASVSASLASISKNSEMISQLVALESAIPNFGALLGAGLGGGALALWDIEGVFWFNAGTFFVSLMLVSGLPVLNNSRAEINRQPTKGGYAFIKDYPGVLRLLFIFGIANFFLAPIFLYLPLLVRDVLNAGGADLAMLEMGLAGGSLFITLYLFAYPKEFSRIKRLFFLNGTLSAAIFLLLGYADSIWTIFGCLIIWGCSVAFVNYLAVSSFQRILPNDCKGRFFGLLASFCTLGIPLSYTFFAILSNVFPLQQIIFNNGICIFVVACFFLTIQEKNIKSVKVAVKYD